MPVAASSSAGPADAPREIKPTSWELKQGKFGPLHVQAALEALHQDGFAVLKSVVDIAHVDHINSYMTKEADDLVKNKTKPFNQGVECMWLPCFPRVKRD
jgi:hypothetical protein